MRVLGMGNALVDVLVCIDDDKSLEELDLPKGSMQLIDERRFQFLHNKIEEMKKFMASGGSASNTIAGIARLGIESGFLGRIGEDFYGKYYKKDLQKYGIKSHLREVEAHSGVATTFVSEDGERTFGTFLGAAAGLTVNDLEEQDFSGYSYFYIEGYLVQNLDLIRTAIRLAKNAGAKVVLDLASFNVVEDNRDFLIDILPQYVDIVFANEEEAKALLNLEAEEAVEKLSQWTEIAIVKTGAKGSWVQQGDEKVFIPALCVHCLDTTGAGDLYAGGFLYGLIRNYSLEKSARIGTLLAANVIQEIGAKISEHRWVEIIKEIEKM